MSCSGDDFTGDDVVVSIGPTGVIGSGRGSDIMDSVCITVDAATDDRVEGEESFTIVGEVINNAGLAEFPDGNTVSITLQDISGEYIVEHLNSGHVGDEHFVHCSDVIPCGNVWTIL